MSDTPMNNENNNSNGDSRMGGVTREDVLIGRVVDHEASAGDWAELERLAHVDAGVWERLACAQRAHARLSAAVEDHVAVAELVEAEAVRPRRDIAGAIGRIGGWAVAASLAVAWGMMATMGGAPPSTTPGPVSVGTPKVDGGRGAFEVDYPSADEAEDQWLSAKQREGSLVSEFPGELLEVQATGDGEYRILVMRKFVEQKRIKNIDSWRFEVDEFGNVVTDELGQPVVVPGEPPAFVGDEPI